MSSKCYYADWWTDTPCKGFEGPNLDPFHPEREIWICLGHFIERFEEYRLDWKSRMEGFKAGSEA